MAAEAKRVARPHPQQMVKCPRCGSPDTKFCYYNNYSTTQPRYFCKNCKRYWTDGGTLRNVPVGGGLRKNKRSAKTKVSNNTPSSPPSSHHKPSSSTPMSSACNIISSMATASNALLNLSNENHNPSPHSSSMPNSAYPVFNPRIYEAGDQTTQVHGTSNMPYQLANFSHQIVPPSPLSILGGLKQQGPAISTSQFLNGYGHERILSDSLQPAGFHHGSLDTVANSLNMTSFVNVNDWQQISEGLFGGGGGGETNFMVMQQAPQPPQWADFDTGTRL